MTAEAVYPTRTSPPEEAGSNFPSRLIAGPSCNSASAVPQGIRRPTAKARVRAQDATPSLIARIADENRSLKDENASLRKQLAEEHETTKTLAKIVAELSLELHQAREELTALQQVPHIGTHSPRDRPPGT